MILILIIYFFRTISSFKIPFCNFKAQPRNAIRVNAMNNEKTSSSSIASSSSSSSSSSLSSSSSQVMKMLLDMNSPTPGFTNQTPISSTDRSQKELIKLVLTIVITWMSVDNKLKQIWGVNDNDENKIDQDSSFIQLKDEKGILNMNVLREGKGKVNTDTTTINYDYRILYNGLNVDQKSNNNLVLSSKTTIPLGFRSLLLGMKAGERRRALMTPDFAFNSDDLPDTIAEDGTVIVEVECNNVD